MEDMCCLSLYSEIYFALIISKIIVSYNSSVIMILFGKINLAGLSVRKYQVFFQSIFYPFLQILHIFHLP